MKSRCVGMFGFFACIILSTTGVLAAEPRVDQSTYMGGYDDDVACRVTVDGQTNICVAGMTASTNFPVFHAFQPTSGQYRARAPGFLRWLKEGADNDPEMAKEWDRWDAASEHDAFFCRLAGGCTSLNYATYWGGSMNEEVNGLCASREGSICYGVGVTRSDDFPRTNSLGTNAFGTSRAFVTALDSNGIPNLSTFVGGMLLDSGMAVAVDTSNNLYVAGNTMSDSFPVKNAMQPQPGAGTNILGMDVFLIKIDASRTNIVYATYLGGSGLDECGGLAVDRFGAVYLAGRTTSTNFPVVNARHSVYRGGDADAFITKINPSGQEIVYSTYLGGARADAATAVVVDEFGNVVVGGSTTSVDFPTTNAFQTSLSGVADMFLVKISSDGSNVQYSTFIGGSGSETLGGLSLDASNNAYWVGTTASSNFPITNAFQSVFRGNLKDGDSDAVVGRFDAAGHLVFASYLGGDGRDSGRGITVGPEGNIYVVGSTSSKNFPTTTNAFQKSNAGQSDGFITILAQ